MTHDPILLVEDNRDDEALTLRALKKNHIGNEIIVASDGVQALDYLFGTGAYAGRDLSESPQLVLLDLNLPRLGGQEVLRRIRAAARPRMRDGSRAWPAYNAYRPPMSKTDLTSPLVAAAAAIDEELCAYDELARDAKRLELDGGKSLGRAAHILEEATTRQPQIQEKLRVLVGEIEAAQDRQQQSLGTLVAVSRAVADRAAEFEGLMNRFGALGESAKAVNQLTGELSARRKDGAPDGEVLVGLRSVEERMNAVVMDAESLARDASLGGWPEIARQAEAVRQQVCSARNKLALAHRAVSERAPS